MTKRKHEEDVAETKQPKKPRPPDQTTTIKCGLRSVLRCKALLPVIEAAVQNVSAMCYEATKLLNLHALRVQEESLHDTDWITIDSVIEYAFMLVSDISTVDRDYLKEEAKIRGEVEGYRRGLWETWHLYMTVRPSDLPVPSRDYIGQLMKFARKSFKTAAKNHVTTNFYRRHRQYIKQQIERKLPHVAERKSFATLVYRIYKETTCEVKAIRMDKTLDQILAGDDEALTWCKQLVETIRGQLQGLQLFPVSALKLGRDWYRFLPWFHVILKASHENEAKGDSPTETKSDAKETFRPKKTLKTFTLLPEFKIQTKNVMIDSTALRSLCTAAASKTEQKRPLVNKGDTDDQLWERILRLNKVPRHDKRGGYKFGNVLTTDGISANLNLRRPDTSTVHAKKQPLDPAADPQPDSRRAPQLKFSPLDLDAKTRVVGLDPGRRDIFCAVDSEQKGRSISWSTRKYHHEAGFNRRKWQTALWMERNPGVDKAMLGMPTSRVATSKQYLEHVAYALGAYKTSQRFYAHPKHRRWRWRVYIGKHKTLDKMCKEISGGKASTVVAFGAAGFSSSSRGHAAGPVKTLRTRLRQHCTVVDVDVDEFRTSQMCSKCECRDKMPGLPIRGSRSFKVRVCPNQSCRTVWNRDVNAAQNMLAVFRYMNSQEGVLRPPRFCR